MTPIVYVPPDGHAGWDFRYVGVRLAQTHASPVLWFVAIHH